jgi:hypothetical protein
MPSTPSRGGTRRARGNERRRPVTIKLTLAERDKAEATAARTGLALAAWIAEAAMDAADHRAISVPKLQREMLAALLEVTEQVRLVSADLSQAVARLDASGVPGPDLEPTARYCARVIRRVEEAAELVSRRLR